MLLKFTVAFLRVLNPSPYMFYLNFDGLQLVGASPELLACVAKSGLVETRPIAGARPRGTVNEDAKASLMKSLWLS